MNRLDGTRNTMNKLMGLALSIQILILRQSLVLFPYKANNLVWREMVWLGGKSRYGQCIIFETKLTDDESYVPKLFHCVARLETFRMYMLRLLDQK